MTAKIPTDSRKELLGIHTFSPKNTLHTPFHSPGETGKCGIWCEDNYGTLIGERLNSLPMTAKKSRFDKEKLRRKAEEILSKRREGTSKEPAGDIQKLVHELEVHQIELEMQNDELRKNQAEIADARDRFLDLYDFAPVAYFTLDGTGRVLEVNLAGANLAGLPRTRLIGMPFTSFLEDKFLNSFHVHLKKVFSSEVAQIDEVRIKQWGKNVFFYVSIQSLATQSDKGMRCRSTATDITERKLAEEELRRAREELVRTNDRLRHLSDRLLEVQEEERKRISLEVHDSFASSLTAIRQRLQGIPSKIKDEYNLEEVLDHLETAVGDALRIQTSLRPSALDDLGIGPALNWSLREFQKTHPLIRVEKTFQFGEADIPNPIKVAIFRITEEALNNIGKHSKADYVTLLLSKTNHSIDLMIRDNGQGFDEDRILSVGNSYRGLGLSSMKERASLSGGSLRIESASGRGASIHVLWPLAEGA
jgi:PAS domain S-box-containing protein